MEPTNINTNTPSHTGARVVAPALLVVLLIVGGYYWYKSSDGRAPMSDTIEDAQPGMDVTRTDLSASSVSRLPGGFPSNVPIEESNIIESYKAVYEEYGVTQYTVRYSTDKSLDAIWKIYSDFATTAGYSIDQDTSKRADGYLRAVRGNDEWSIAFNKADRNQVVVTYIDRE